jgi:predicted DNA-binding transcriptional regulator AlpA
MNGHIKKPSEDAALTVEEVAEYLKLAEMTIYRLAGA